MWSTAIWSISCKLQGYHIFDRDSGQGRTKSCLGCRVGDNSKCGRRISGCGAPGKDQTRGHGDTKRCHRGWCSRWPAGWQCRQHRSVPVPLMRAEGTSGRAYLSSSPVETTGKNRFEPLEGAKPLKKLCFERASISPDWNLTDVKLSIP